MTNIIMTLSIMTHNIMTLSIITFSVEMNVEGVTLVLPSRLFRLSKYWRILALS